MFIYAYKVRHSASYAHAPIVSTCSVNQCIIGLIIIHKQMSVCDKTADLEWYLEYNGIYNV